MTVSYNDKVATASFLGFPKLLVRWRGSAYKLLWRDFLIYFAMYWVLQVIDWYALGPEEQASFRQVGLYCRNYTNLIPVNFVLGFYVTSIVGRW